MLFLGGVEIQASTDFGWGGGSFGGDSNLAGWIVGRVFVPSWH